MVKKATFILLFCVSVGGLGADTGACLAAAPIPVFRFYHPFLNTHLLTTDENEKYHLDDTWGWIYEGIGWYGFPHGQEPGLSPVYRFYDTLTNHHRCGRGPCV